MCTLASPKCLYYTDTTLDTRSPMSPTDGALDNPYNCRMPYTNRIRVGNPKVGAVELPGKYYRYLAQMISSLGRLNSRDSVLPYAF